MQFSSDTGTTLLHRRKAAAAAALTEWVGGFPPHTGRAGPQPLGLARHRRRLARLLFQKGCGDTPASTVRLPADDSSTATA